MTKIACIYHSVDLDGWMSAAIVQHWQLLENNSYIAAGTDIPVIDFIGYNYGQPIPDLSEYDQVIMCDISFPNKEMKKLFVTSKGDNKLTWIDHHISAIKENQTDELTPYIDGIRDPKFAACELTWMHFFPDVKMPEIVRLLGRYDCFGHKGTDEEKYVLEFQYGARESIFDVDTALKHLKQSIKFSSDPEYWAIRGNNIEKDLHISGKAIYSYLCTQAKQIFDHRFTMRFGNYCFAAINHERFNPVNFGIDYHAYKADDVYYYDGVASFWITPKGIKFSLYNDNGKVDCSAIASSLGGGGHKGASGFFLPFDYNGDGFSIYNFKSFLNSFKYLMGNG